MARVVFVQDIVYEYFGVMYMSAYLKQHGHDCDVVIEYADKKWLERIESLNPDKNEWLGPAPDSIKQGEGQLYPRINKI